MRAIQSRFAFGGETGPATSTGGTVASEAESSNGAGAPNLLTIDVTGQAVVDGCRISFTNEAGSHPGPTDQLGVYDFTVDATTLAFTVVTDLCDDRRRLHALPLRRTNTARPRNRRNARS
jgi:hypothetical protein